MHATAAQRAQRSRQHGRKGLALAGLHFDDVAGIEREGGDDLDIEGSQPESAVSRVASKGKELVADRFRRGAGLLAKTDGARPQFRITEPRDLDAEASDLRQRLFVRAQIEHDRRALNACKVLTPSDGVVDHGSLL